MSILKQYTEAMIAGQHVRCAHIEQCHDMYGYPPEIVSIGLAAIDDGKDGHEAIDAYINGEQQCAAQHVAQENAK